MSLVLVSQLIFRYLETPLSRAAASDLPRSEAETPAIFMSPRITFDSKFNRNREHHGR